TGRPPFAGPNGFAVMLAHQNTAPLSPSEIDPAIDRHLSQVILKALEKEPSRRFPNAASFRDALEKAMMPPEFETMPEKRPAAMQWRGGGISRGALPCGVRVPGPIVMGGGATGAKTVATPRAQTTVPEAPHPPSAPA